jgi:hypothetical protein
LLVTEERLRLPSEELKIEYSQATGNWTRNSRSKQIGKEMSMDGLPNEVFTPFCQKKCFILSALAKAQKDAKIATIGPDNCKLNRRKNQTHVTLFNNVTSVADQDSSDPCVFGPPGSGSVSQVYESGSGPFYYQAKIVRKTPY